MTIIALEEHLATETLFGAWQAVEPAYRGLALEPSNSPDTRAALLDVGAGRIEAMDRMGVDVQVLQMATPGLQNLPPRQAVALQAQTNDVIADAVRAHPDRLQGLATLATPAPHQAVRELERAVTQLGLDGAVLFGRTRDKNLDDPEFWPIFEAAAALRAPLYLHPQTPPPAVREAYYNGLGKAADAAFATHGIGWYYESGVQLLRLALSGVFERFPDLQVIAGHWGEVVTFFLDPVDHLTPTLGLPRTPSEYLATNVSITPSGMLNHRYLRWALEVLGPRRILFATDYPFVPMAAGAAPHFLDTAGLDPETRELIASENWQRLRAGIKR